MATPRAESLISCCERNEALREGGEARPLTVETHDGTYYGVEDTVDFLEHQPNHGRIQVYVRSEDPLHPTLKYDSESMKSYPSAKEALVQLKESQLEHMDRKSSIERILRVRLNPYIKLNDNELDILNQFVKEVAHEFKNLRERKRKEEQSKEELSLDD